MKSPINRYLVLIVAFFSLIYTFLSIIPHFNFQTNAFDLGIFNQTLHQYAHFSMGPNTVRVVPTLLADHFEGILLLFSPFYWLFGSYTLLLIQILSVILGGIGVYLVVKKETQNNQTLALAAIIIFYLFFGIYTALAFDYHNNVVGSMLIPWLFYFLSQRKFGLYYLMLFLFLISKENMALISAFLGLSLLIFEPREIKKHGLITFLISVFYFFLILKVISYLNGGYDHWSYAALGSSPLEALKFIFLHPFQTVILFFNDPIKIKMWVLFLLSGGILAIFKPKYALLLVPVMAQKFFSERPDLWRHTLHYAVELAPVVAIGSALFIAQFKKPAVRHGLIGLFILLNLGILGTINFYNGDKIFRIFAPGYYQIDYRNEMNHALELVKGAESVSAQNSVIPHLKNKFIRLFPAIEDADYIILNLNDRVIWPFENEAELKYATEHFEDIDRFQKIYDEKGICVFQRAMD